MPNLLQWKDGKYSGHTGSAGGIRLFVITWKTRRDQPDWVMKSDLPGHAGQEWKHDSADQLKTDAEKLLASWLSQVTGGGR